MPINLAYKGVLTLVRKVEFLKFSMPIEKQDKTELLHKHKRCNNKDTQNKTVTFNTNNKTKNIYRKADKKKKDDIKKSIDNIKNLQLMTIEFI